MAKGRMTVKVNDGAPDDLEINGRKLKAGDEVDLPRKHVRALGSYVSPVEVAAPAAKPAPATTKKPSGKR